MDKHSKAKEILEVILEELPIEIEKEYYPISGRNFRIDYAIPDLMLAIEYEGGIFSESGGHRSISIFLKNLEKYNEEAILGWKLFRVTANCVKDQYKLKSDLERFIFGKVLN